MKLFIVFAVALVATSATGQSICSLTWEQLTGDDSLFFPGEPPADCFSIFNQLKDILANPLSLKNIYDQYKAKFNKSGRFQLTTFATRLISIAENNIKNALGQSTWFGGLNKFSDMTSEELKKYTGEIALQNNSTFNLPSLPSFGFRALAPDSLDWRTSGIVNPVKNQGECGSCWAFGTIAIVESALAKKTGKLQVLSEQELVDCVVYPSGGGCNGGYFQAGLKYIKDSGVTTAASYGYKGTQATCAATGKTRVARVATYGGIASGDEVAMKDAVYNYGPIATSALVGSEWFSYKGGVFNGVCGDGGHAMATVGYGTELNKPFWIIRNSWGADWGEKGYIRLARGVNKCTIASRNVQYTTVL